MHIIILVPESDGLRGHEFALHGGATCGMTHDDTIFFYFVAVLNVIHFTRGIGAEFYVSSMSHGHHGQSLSELPGGQVSFGREDGRGGLSVLRAPGYPHGIARHDESITGLARVASIGLAGEGDSGSRSTLEVGNANSLAWSDAIPSWSLCLVDGLDE